MTELTITITEWNRMPRGRQEQWLHAPVQRDVTAHAARDNGSTEYLLECGHTIFETMTGRRKRRFACSTCTVSQRAQRKAHITAIAGEAWGIER